MKLQSLDQHLKVRIPNAGPDKMDLVEGAVYDMLKSIIQELSEMDVTLNMMPMIPKVEGKMTELVKEMVVVNQTMAEVRDLFKTEIVSLDPVAEMVMVGIKVSSL